MTKLWRIGELARETGLTVRALHHYDQVGLLVPSSRTSGGHRCYTQADVRRLHRIVVLRGFGFPLENIAVLLRGEQDPRDLIRDQLAVVGERIARATALRDRLLGVLDGLDRAVEPSTSEFLRLTEETITMNQPLTTEEFAQLTRNLQEHAPHVGPKEHAALRNRREESEQRRAALARMVPPGTENPGDSVT